jgi:hypothetical protein
VSISSPAKSGKILSFESQQFAKPKNTWHGACNYPRNNQSHLTQLTVIMNPASVTLLKNVALNLAVAATAVAAFNAAPISGETLFNVFAIGGVAGIALNDYRTRRTLQLRLRARTVVLAARRNVSALVAA